MSKEQLPVSDAVNTWGGLEFVRVHQCEFLMGSLEDDELAWDDEKPQHRLEILYDYWVGRFPITNVQFGAFAQAASYETRAERAGWAWVWNVQEETWVKTPGADWQHPLGPQSSALDEHPAVQVCFYDALAFCEWLNQKHAGELPPGYVLRLPSEVEWEKAARGAAGRRWPWGNSFDAALCNSKIGGPGGTTPIGAYSPAGDSVYGIADMSGNAWEWTVTLWGADKNSAAFTYPYQRQDGREDLNAGDTVYRIIRGGSFKDDVKGVRAACRDLDPPAGALNNLGLRVIVAPPIV
jgi:formylglycine-generating enzyme required for sulfatase activity